MSAISGVPRLLGWANETPHMHLFNVPGATESLEQVIASSFYAYLTIKIVAIIDPEDRVIPIMLATKLS